MDLSGLIFVALALVWGVVLIPKALRAHDDAARTRSVEASSDDARVLPRGARTAASPPLVETPEHGATVDAPAPTLPVVLARQRQLAGAAARRRRRVLGILVLLTVATGVASLAGLLAPWAPVVPVVLTVVFLALALVMVLREHSAW